jgi:FixJ family two-component response regulator
MAPVVKQNNGSIRTKPCVLIVDDELATIEMVNDVVGSSIDCRIIAAHDFHEARALLGSEDIQLLVTDIHLPDGDGMALLSELQSAHPQAAAVVMTGDTSVQGAVRALRAGVLDFLPKPFSAEVLIDRVQRALDRQRIDAREARRIKRLKLAVKRLNTSRRLVSRKVDLLCNDLITAYGELSRQMDQVRLQEAFRKLMNEAKDLEQLLCHAMDWVLREIGYSNVAIWLASEEQEFELGAYMKYTIACDTKLTEAIQQSLLPMTVREGTLRLSDEEVTAKLSPTESAILRGQTVVGINCTYLGEPLAAFILFRDQRSPFTDEDVAMLKAIAPIFSVALAATVRQSQKADMDDSPFYEGEDGHGEEERNEKEKRDSRSEADWWKRGEPPPF